MTDWSCSKANQQDDTNRFQQLMDTTDSPKEVTDTMPKDTFRNLPLEKRQKIEQAAVEEFAENSYDSASINRIVEKAGIPKGSFYQYFTDKQDLLRHILDLIVEQKLATLSPVMANPFQMEFFALLREIYGAGLRFATANPQLQQIGKRLLADRKHPVFVELVRDNKVKSDEIFQLLLKQAIERGEIRPDIDLPFVAHLISELNVSVADYYVEHEGFRFDDTYMDTVDKMIFFLREGIGQSKDQSSGTADGCKDSQSSEEEHKDHD